MRVRCLETDQTFLVVRCFGTDQIRLVDRELVASKMEQEHSDETVFFVNSQIWRRTTVFSGQTVEVEDDREEEGGHQEMFLYNLCESTNLSRTSLIFQPKSVNSLVC